ncbi:uncharacterized protein LOC126735025 [Anthonomus grandis grandis]|uniref:uncharacterized protein LOC126735025 n=1 Tax=Anthonomus grandis grandis TaxID=2921223 RepID=UPI0021664B64|nr:uncharacterized protein LOC126735025 [Anthonomus grandis grandis]
MSEAGGGGPPQPMATMPKECDAIDNGNVDVCSISIEASNTKKNDLEKEPVFYSKNDTGPFLVYLESTEKVGFNVGKFNNIKIARDIFNLNLTDVKKIKNKGLNRISVEFINFLSANNFVKNKTLINKGYKIYIPFNFVTCKGLVRQIDIEIGEKEILECSKTDTGIEILEVKRLNRKIIKDKDITYEPTGSVLITFKGVCLPKSLNIYRLERPISIYISPVTQCFRCLRYGHTRTNCKGKERCFTCGEEKKSDLEEHPSCETKCFYCKGPHKSTDKSCPEYTRQKNIKELMAFENIPFFDASEIVKKTYLTRNEFVYHPSDFPNIKNLNSPEKNYLKEKVIQPSQRRTQHAKTDPIKRSYQQVVSENNTKKRIIHKGYDVKAHNDNLISPNSRPQKEASSPIFSLTKENSLKTQMPSTSAVHSFNSHESSWYPDEVKSIIDAFLNMSENNKRTIKTFLFNQNFDMDIDPGSQSDSFN